MPLPRKPPPKQPSPPPAPPRLALLLNGEPHEVAADATVLDLVTGLGHDPRTVAVERNGDLVPRAAFPATRLAAGDRLEVVHFVQGGCR
ncbi:MAG TPA: sulfur carrier protein ThiS [Thermoanaerobaculia bacterium]|nr:sulfur carrier protein ThiS [Thermoanaerobaculia bacterium]